MNIENTAEIGPLTSQNLQTIKSMSFWQKQLAQNMPNIIYPTIMKKGLNIDFTQVGAISS